MLESHKFDSTAADSFTILIKDCSLDFVLNGSTKEREDDDSTEPDYTVEKFSSTTVLCGANLSACLGL